MLKQIPVDELEYGMYVAALDREWTETPFLFQGFYVNSEQDIERLRQYCRHVYIDDDPAAAPDPDTPAPQGASAAGTSRTVRRPLFDGVGGQVYEPTASFHEELGRAKHAHDLAQQSLRDAFEKVYTDGRVNVSAVDDAVGAVMGSVLRNPDAFSWISKVYTSNTDLYAHMVGTAGVAAVFGRHLGLPRAELEQLIIGGLVFDVGKLCLPEALLNKTEPLTPDEVERLKGHCWEGARLLQDNGGFAMPVIDIVLYHHERHDGSGYPEGHTSETTPLLAQIVGIADCYDAMTNDRPYRKAMSPQQALDEVYGWRDTLFHADLVEEFIQSIGIYPVGTFVELSTGHVGVVVGQNHRRRLRPKIVMLQDDEGRAYDVYAVVDLATETTDHVGNPLNIRRAFSPQHIPVELTELSLEAV